MTWHPKTWPRTQAVFTLICLAAVASEGYAVFAKRTSTFSIAGARAYEIPFSSGGDRVGEIAELTAQNMVWQAFQMRGEGLQSVRVRLRADTFSAARLRLTLWRGSPDQLEMTKAFEVDEPVALRPGRQWVSITFPRDGTSHDRWYTFDVRLLEASARPRPDGTAQQPRISIGASHDNPDRGGVLWIDGVRQPGSLFLKADRRGRTRYDKFLLETAPNLPPSLRIRAVQWLVFAALHWAMVVFAYTLIAAASETPPRPSIDP
jgi:hypothetical protein